MVPLTGGVTCLLRRTRVLYLALWMTNWPSLRISTPSNSPFAFDERSPSKSSTLRRSCDRHARWESGRLHVSTLFAHCTSRRESVANLGRVMEVGCV